MENFRFNSKNIFLAKENSRIEEVAKRNKIVLPSNHTALFQAVLSPIETANSNGHRLSKKAVEESLSTFIGSQVNINHRSPEENRWMVGNILDAWISENDEIEVIFSFAKNIYQEEYLSALEAMGENKLTVSWELSADTKDVEKMMDGTLKLHAITWDGMAVLIGKSPGYKKARVYEMASLYRQRALESNKEVIFAEQIVKDCDEILSKEETDSYILSEQEIVDFVTEMQTKLKKQKKNKPKDIWSEEEKQIELEAARWSKKYINDLPDSSFAVIEPDYQTGVIGDKNTRHLPFKDKDGKIDLPHYRNALARVNQIKPITKSISKEDLVDKAKKELEKHKDVLNSQLEEKGEIIMTEEDKKLISDLKAEFGDAVKDWKDEDFLNTTKVEEIRTSLNATKKDVVENKMYSEEEVNAVKSELSSKLEESDSKLKTLEAENIELKKKVEAQELELGTFRTAEEARIAKEKADKLAAIKADLKDNPYTKEFQDEDYFNAEKVQIAKDRHERDVLKAENEALKKVTPEDKTKVNAEKKKDLSTGANEQEVTKSIKEVFSDARNRKE